MWRAFVAWGTVWYEFALYKVKRHAAKCTYYITMRFLSFGLLAGRLFTGNKHLLKEVIIHSVFPWGMVRLQIGKTYKAFLQLTSFALPKGC